MQQDAEGDRAIPSQVLWNWRHQAREQAIAAQISPSEVDWLLAELTDLTPLDMRLETVPTRPTILCAVSLDELEQRWQRRRVDRVPVQYLAGTTTWRHFSLQVTPDVLIPRPDTEEIIDLALMLTPEATDRTGHWADLGTGSGAIALGLADAFPQAIVHAVDCSAAALAVAQHNARMNGLGDRIQFHQGSWFEPLAPWRGALRGLLSNPPYIPQSTLATLQPEVVQHEPRQALDGGLDGLDAIRILLQQAPDYLRARGLWLIEMMQGQGSAIAQLLQQSGHYGDIQIHLDLSGNERFVSARLSD